jgi:hypothetical protein
MLATKKSWRKPKLHLGAYGRLDWLPGAVQPPVPSNELQARTRSKRHGNDPKFHPDAPLIKANKLTEENMAKQNFDQEGPELLDRPL